MPNFLNIVNNFKNTTTTERIILSLSGLLFIFVAPITILRFVQQDWNIFYLDLFLVGSAAMVFFNTYRRTHVAIMRYYLCTLVTLGSSLSVIFNGVEQVYWVYPSTLTLFFLLRPLAAFAFTIGICVLIFPTVMFGVGSMEMMTIFFALFGTAFFINIFASEILNENVSLSSLAEKDFLTGCGNRRAFRTEIERRFIDFKSKNQSSSLILMDIDNFKLLNDKFGHAVGDKVLQVLANLVTYRIRRSDQMYRLGGEEFAVVLPNTELSDSLHVTDEIQSALSKQQEPGVPPFTISIGLTQLKHGESVDDWIARTDKAMYQSKNTGKNKVTQMT